MTAMLCWRRRWLARHLAPRDYQAVQLLPVLLQANFSHRELRGDPPGVAGVKSQRRWAPLARAFHLPPPSGSQRGRRMISALLAIPGREGVDTFAVLDPALGPRELDRVRARLEVAQSLLRAEGVKLTLQPLSLADRTTARVPLGLLPFGALLAGGLGLDFWDRVAAPHLVEDQAEISDLWQRSPTPLTRLMLMYLAPVGGPPPFPSLWRLLGQGVRPKDLQDPDWFCTLWAAETTRRPGALFELAGQVASAATRRLALRHAGHGGTDELLEPRAVLAIGRAIGLELARAIRPVNPPLGGPLRRALRRDVLSAGCPTVLLGALGRSLARTRPANNAPGWLTEEHHGGVTEVFAPGAASLGIGSRPEQAWARALFLLFRSLGAPSAIPDAPPMFQRLGPRLFKPCEQRTLAVVARAEEIPGPPHDPLNRGPDRQLAVREALVVTLLPDGRPSARSVAPSEAAQTLILEAGAGTAVEVIAADADSEVTAARLGRVAGRCRNHALEIPLTLEVGGRALAFEPDRPLRRFPVASYASRPRSFAADPEAWDFGGAVGAGRVSRTGGRAIDCLVWALDETQACVWYSTADGLHLRETAPIASLEKHLEEGQRLARQSDPPMVMTLRAAPDVAARVARCDPFLDNVVTVDIRGRLGLGLTIELGGEQFGAGTGLGFRAAAEAMLSRWPPGIFGHLKVGAMDVDCGARQQSALHRLYARSIVYRRLRAHIRRACRPEGDRWP